MKLGAALVTATLGAAGIACDGDRPHCDFPLDRLLNGASYDSIESYWYCEVSVGGESSGSAGFVIFEDGTAALIPALQLSWEEGEDVCDAPVFTIEEGYDLFGDGISNFSFDGDGLTFDIEAGPPSNETYSFGCEKISFEEVP